MSEFKMKQMRGLISTVNKRLNEPALQFTDCSQNLNILSTFTVYSHRLDTSLLRFTDEK